MPREKFIEGEKNLIDVDVFDSENFDSPFFHPSEDIEQISVEINDDVNNISEIKNAAEELIENVIKEGKENATETINEIYESLDQLTIECDDESLDSDDETIDNSRHSVTTVRCDCCQDLIFFNKYDSTCPLRCESCQLKYMN